METLKPMPALGPVVTSDARGRTRCYDRIAPEPAGLVRLLILSRNCSGLQIRSDAGLPFWGRIGGGKNMKG